MLGEEVALGDVWVAGEDERLDAERPVAEELGEHLVGIADDRGAAAAAGPADARPEVGLDVAVVGGGIAELGLAPDPDRGAVE